MTHRTPFPSGICSTLARLKSRRLCSRYWAIAAGAAFLACAPASLAQAQAPTSSYTNRFDDASSVASWIYWYGLGYNNTPVTWSTSSPGRQWMRAGITVCC